MTTRISFVVIVTVMAVLATVATTISPLGHVFAIHRMGDGEGTVAPGGIGSAASSHTAAAASRASVAAVAATEGDAGGDDDFDSVSGSRMLVADSEFEEAEISSVGEVRAIVAYDFDGDGDMDIVIADSVTGM